MNPLSCFLFLVEGVRFAIACSVLEQYLGLQTGLPSCFGLIYIHTHGDSTSIRILLWGELGCHILVYGLPWWSISRQFYLISLTFHLLSQLNTVLYRVKKSLYNIIKYKGLLLLLTLDIALLYVTKEKVSTLKFTYKYVLSFNIFGNMEKDKNFESK